MTNERASVRVLQECIVLQNCKSSDYQNAASTVKQADYYPSGVFTIYEIMHAKMLRLKSVLEASRYNEDYNPNFESVEDSAKDLINYASFMVAYARNEVEGQLPNRDMFNREITQTDTGDVDFFQV